MGKGYGDRGKRIGNMRADMKKGNWGKREKVSSEKVEIVKLGNGKV